MSRWYNRPSKFHPDAIRDATNQVGLAHARAVLAAAEERRATVDDEPLTEREKTMLACRQRARRERRERERQKCVQAGNTTDSTQIGAMLRQVRST